MLNSGYEYKPCYQNGKPDGYWQTHMIGTEWIRIDFNKPTRVTGLKVSIQNKNRHQKSLVGIPD